MQKVTPFPKVVVFQWLRRFCLTAVRIGKLFLIVNQDTLFLTSLSNYSDGKG
jgi:hypothetical protein